MLVLCCQIARHCGHNLNLSRKTCSSSTRARKPCQFKIVKENLLIVYTSNENCQGYLSRKNCSCKRRYKWCSTPLTIYHFPCNSIFNGPVFDCIVLVVVDINVRPPKCSIGIRFEQSSALTWCRGNANLESSSQVNPIMHC